MMAMTTSNSIRVMAERFISFPFLNRSSPREILSGHGVQCQKVLDAAGSASQEIASSLLTGHDRREKMVPNHP
jgi:hypothetical protein